MTILLVAFKVDELFGYHKWSAFIDQYKSSHFF